MISNKRFSYAPASSSTAFHPGDYPLTNGHFLNSSNLKNPQNILFENPNQSSNQLLYQRKAKDRNSLSLNHEFSHMYISKQNHNLGPKAQNYGTSQTKAFGRSLGPSNNNTINNNNNISVDILPTLEEVQKHKRNAAEAKKQMTQMEKSISFWCDCTDYWRTKWRKTKDEKRKLAEETRSLRSQITVLEKQLKISEEKRSKLREKFQQMYEKTSNQIQNSKTSKSLQNSQNLKNSNITNLGSRQSGSRNSHAKDLEIDELQVLDSHVYGQILPGNSLSSQNILSNSSSKIVLRNHDRLLDKKITNRKRFSQVVMCDAEELFQMNQIENPSGENTLQRQSLPPNIEEEPEGYGYEHGNLNEDNDNYNDDNVNFSYVTDKKTRDNDYRDNNDKDQERGFQYEPEDDETSDLRNVSLKVRQHLLKGISGVSTLETNSECVNVGSVNDDQSTAIDGDDDSTANEDDDDDEDEDDDGEVDKNNANDRSKESNERIQQSNERTDKGPIRREEAYGKIEPKRDESYGRIESRDKNPSIDKRIIRSDSGDGDADYEDDGEEDVDEDSDDEDDEV